MRNDEFTEVVKKGKKVVNSEFALFYFPNQLNNCQFGISVPRKLVKKAVRRNYYKRQIRNILKSEYNKNICQNLPSAHYSFLVIVRSGFLTFDQFLIKQNSLTELLNSTFQKKVRRLDQSADKRMFYA